MGKWLRRVRGAVGMGLIWAIGWAVIGGGVMELIVDPHGRILDMWPQTLAIPGFFGGVVFSAMLGMAERRRRFSELSVPRFGALGAVTIAGPVTLLSALSAAGSLALARRGEPRELPGSGSGVADPES